VKVYGEKNMHAQSKSSVILISSVLFGILICIPVVSAQELEDMIFVEGAYQNPVYTEPPSGVAISTTGNSLFSGNVNAPDTAPNDGAHYLVQSTFGWTTPATVGWQHHAAARRYFYAAYKLSPYLTYPIEGVDQDDWPGVRHLLLDVAYYRGVSFIMCGNLALERAFSVRFLEDLRSPDDADTINDELRQLGWNVGGGTFHLIDGQGAWKFFTQGSQVWLDLFTSPIQRDYLRKFSSGRSLSYNNHEVFETTSAPEGVQNDWPPIVYDGPRPTWREFAGMFQRRQIVSSNLRFVIRERVENGYHSSQGSNYEL
jgi:hypothetical protein